MPDFSIFPALIFYIPIPLFLILKGARPYLLLYHFTLSARRAKLTGPLPDITLKSQDPHQELGMAHSPGRSLGLYGAGILPRPGTKNRVGLPPPGWSV
jgi:hypothetical protein